MLRCQLFLPYWLGLSTGARQRVWCHHCNGWGRDRVDHHSKLGRVEGVSEITSQFYTLESSCDFCCCVLMVLVKVFTFDAWFRDNMKSVDKLSLCTHKSNCSWLYLAPTSTSNTLKQQWQVHLFIGLFVYQSFLADRIINENAPVIQWLYAANGWEDVDTSDFNHPFSTRQQGMLRKHLKHHGRWETWTFQCLKLMLSWRHKFKTPNVQGKFAQRYTLWATHIENEVSMLPVYYCWLTNSGQRAIG